MVRAIGSRAYRVRSIGGRLTPELSGGGAVRLNDGLGASVGDEMEKTEKRTTYTCDLCGKECLPLREISIPARYYMDLVTTVKVRIVADSPYGTDHGDVCPECAKAMLKKWLESA